ncbi:Barrierpepsin [Wickerhamomyces ciferrii]|uniref:Barrierpepsin n=1 Tax=Wickerhamomyces ciferrii (strain ATCC 14091 / BCRC 22168 / CBS 111 / JCM 3599 / NBRC 0793 / NRRL Y-1031 F-60-10) TaxID=1206466 RepID=K0KA43_WICCF|nr:Barrierpepsin [Wickerhamomyces ciferrii]CCH41785.1 Barrierpepsin [Wickerhamomyces ciferrii]
MFINKVLITIGLCLQVCLASKIDGVTKLNFNINAKDADFNHPHVKRLLKRAEGGGGGNDTSPVVLQNMLTFFSINATFGTPEQEFQLVLGTGTSDTWVLKKGNPYCSSSTRNNKRAIEDINFQKRAESDSSSFPSASRAAGFASGTRTSTGSAYVPYASATYDCIYGSFDEDASESLKKNSSAPPLQIGYTEGSTANGEWVTDKLKISDFELDNFSFGIASQANLDGGVLGLGFEEAESTNRRLDGGDNYTYQNFPSRLKNDGLIKKTVYSLYADSFNSSTGSILFGGIDHAKYNGDLVTLPLVNPYEDYGIDTVSYFVVTITGVGTDVEGNQTTFSTTAYPATIDAGTTMTYLPPRFVDEVIEALGASYSAYYGFYTMTCPTLEESLSRFLVFDFQGKKISVPLYQLIRVKIGTLCVLGVTDSYDNSITLGSSFLRSAYVVFDLEDKEVSIAQIKYTEDEKIEVVESSIPSAIKAPEYSSSWSTDIYPTTTGELFESGEDVTSNVDVFGYTGGILEGSITLRSTGRSSSTSGGYSRSSGFASSVSGTIRRTSTSNTEIARSTDSSTSGSNSGSSGSYDTFKNKIWLYLSSMMVLTALVVVL